MACHCFHRALFGPWDTTLGQPMRLSKKAMRHHRQSSLRALIGETRFAQRTCGVWCVKTGGTMVLRKALWQGARAQSAKSDVCEACLVSGGGTAILLRFLFSLTRSVLRDSVSARIHPCVFPVKVLSMSVMFRRCDQKSSEYFRQGLALWGFHQGGVYKSPPLNPPPPSPPLKTGPCPHLAKTVFWPKNRILAKKNPNFGQVIFVAAFWPKRIWPELVA